MTYISMNLDDVTVVTLVNTTTTITILRVRVRTSTSIPPEGTTMYAAIYIYISM
jgi:hypothetical protein